MPAGGNEYDTNITSYVFSLAGGGGGVDKLKTESPRCHGSINQDGNPGYGGSMFTGGSGGRGAEEGDNGYSGGGGAGLKTNGRSNKNFGGAKGTGGEGGKAFTSGNYKNNNVNKWYFHYWSFNMKGVIETNKILK